MDNDHEFAIPAANIGDTDLGALAKTNPTAAKEIARLEDLMHRGEESQDDFHRLCQLLFDFGAAAESEYLLRRNIDYYHGRGLYQQLFGTVKLDEYNRAVAAFEAQFDVALRLTTTFGFLVNKYHSSGRARWDAFQLLSHPCEIKIGYIEQNEIEADVLPQEHACESVGGEDYLSLRFIAGVWRRNVSGM